MRLQLRLTLLLALATLIPLVVTGVVASRLAREFHIAQARELFAKQADGLAVYTETWLGAQLRSIAQSSSTWDPAQLGDAERVGLQRLLYTQFEPVVAVVLLDAEGAPLAEPLVPSPDQLVGSLEGRVSLTPEQAAGWLQQLPDPVAKPGLDPVRLGEVWVPEGQVPLLPVLVGRPGGASVGILLSLQAVDQHFRGQAVEGGAAVLLDSRQRPVAGDEGGLVAPKVLPRFMGQVEGDLRYPMDGGGEVMAAFHSIGDLGWTALVAVPSEHATRGGDLIASRTLYIYGLAAVLIAVMAWVGSRQVSRPILALREATQRLASGELGQQVRVEGKDEIGELGLAFNQMSAALARDQEIIAAQNAEIKAWNAELLRRVEQRTEELQRSQKQLIATSRMAAVAEMGAGLAHELNNPLAGILGMAQIARLKAKGDLEGMLATIEEQARRCATVLRSLTRFAGQSAGPAEIELDLHEVIAEVLALTGGSFRDGGQSLEHDRSVPLRMRGDPVLLAQAFAQLLRSLRTALLPGGRLFIHGSADGSKVRLRFRLSAFRGAGGDDWLASGMGFWSARQIFQEHGGRLEEPEPGAEVAVYTVVLPVG